MGSEDDPSEKPMHRVTIKPLAISKFPITVREWKTHALRQRAVLMCPRARMMLRSQI